MIRYYHDTLAKIMMVSRYSNFAILDTMQDNHLDHDNIIYDDICVTKKKNIPKKGTKQELCSYLLNTFKKMHFINKLKNNQ